MVTLSYSYVISLFTILNVNGKYFFSFLFFFSFLTFLTKEQITKNMMRDYIWGMISKGVTVAHLKNNFGSFLYNSYIYTYKF